MRFNRELRCGRFGIEIVAHGWKHLLGKLQNFDVRSFAEMQRGVVGKHQRRLRSAVGRDVRSLRESGLLRCQRLRLIVVRALERRLAVNTGDKKLSGDLRVQP